MASLEKLLHEVRRIEEHRVELTEKKIKSIYRSLMKDLNSFISEEYVKYADKDGKLFLSYLDSKNKRAKFLEEIVKKVDGISPQVKKEMLDLVEKTFEKSYKGMVEAVKNADDTKELLSSTKTLVRPEVLKQAVNNNIEKLTLPAVMEKHRAEIVADIQQTLTLGLMNGDRYETMAKRIEERLGVSYSKATNISRTESHRNVESGLMDGAKETAKIIEQDGNLIYAAIWRTMKDERVRPNQRRKTKSGWKTYISKNGANHQKMEGVTVKVGEKFQLEPNVYAECPSMSGTARNDCRCRCFLQYKLMTVEEFAKATSQNVEDVKKKYLTNYRDGGIMINGEQDSNIAERSSKNIQVITDSAIGKVPKVNISGFSDEQNAFIQQQHKELLKIARDENDSKEVAFVFREGLIDREHYFGTDDSLDLGTGLFGKGQNIFIMHNHPRNSSYSAKDIALLLSNGDIAGISIVKNNGAVEVLMKTSAYNQSAIVTEFKRIVKKTVRQQTEAEYEKAVLELLKKHSKAGGMFEWIK